MISGSSINMDGTMAVVTGSTLEQRGICATAKYADQITAANCSGFLVGEDLLVTAGHCIRSMGDCRSYKWVFDFAVKSATVDKARVEVEKTAVYGCSEIIEQSLDRSSQDDFALIRLDRKVTDRKVLTVRTEGKVADRTELVVIGHPTGLPTKVADGDPALRLSKYERTKIVQKAAESTGLYVAAEDLEKQIMSFKKLMEKKK